MYYSSSNTLCIIYIIHICILYIYIYIYIYIYMCVSLFTDFTKFLWHSNGQTIQDYRTRLSKILWHTTRYVRKQVSTVTILQCRTRWHRDRQLSGTDRFSSNYRNIPESHKMSLRTHRQFAGVCNPAHQKMVSHLYLTASSLLSRKLMLRKFS
jgi:hypothetical protein